MRRNIIIQLSIILISALLFIPFNGKVNLFDWDEINFAESAREMIVTGDYLNVQSVLNRSGKNLLCLFGFRLFR